MRGILLSFFFSLYCLFLFRYVEVLPSSLSLSVSLCVGLFFLFYFSSLLHCVEIFFLSLSSQLSVNRLSFYQSHAIHLVSQTVSGVCHFKITPLLLSFFLPSFQPIFSFSLPLRFQHFKVSAIHSFQDIFTFLDFFAVFL